MAIGSDGLVAAAAGLSQARVSRFKVTPCAYRSSVRTFCGTALACARIACRPAAESERGSGSPFQRRSPRPGCGCEKPRGSRVTACRLAIVDSKRFWMAPKVLRRLLTAVSAASTRLIAVLAFATVVHVRRCSASSCPARATGGSVKPIAVPSPADHDDRVGRRQRIELTAVVDASTPVATVPGAPSRRRYRCSCRQRAEPVAGCAVIVWRR